MKIPTVWLLLALKIAHGLLHIFCRNKANETPKNQNNKCRCGFKPHCHVHEPYKLKHTVYFLAKKHMFIVWVSINICIHNIEKKNHQKGHNAHRFLDTKRCPCTRQVERHNTRWIICKTESIGSTVECVHGIMTSSNTTCIEQRHIAIEVYNNGVWIYVKPSPYNFSK